MELNPDHPVTQKFRDHWPKIVAILMQKFGVTDVEITVEDIAKLEAIMHKDAVTIDCRDKKFFVRLMDINKAKEIARGGN